MAARGVAAPAVSFVDVRQRCSTPWLPIAWGHQQQEGIEMADSRSTSDLQTEAEQALLEGDPFAGAPARIAINGLVAGASLFCRRRGGFDGDQFGQATDGEDGHQEGMSDEIDVVCAGGQGV